MREAIPGAIGVFLATVFLGFMALDVGSIPLAIIIVAVIAMMIFDLVRTVLGQPDNS